MVTAISLLIGCGGSEQTTTNTPAPATDQTQSPQARDKPPGHAGPDPIEPAQQSRPSPPIVAAARSQVGKTTIYDGAYVGLKYPGGDVPIERGVCTDVVIRALRSAHQIDLQQRVHEDMKRAFSAYPNRWGLTRPDKNIDHRRVPNLRAYFKRQGYAIEPGNDPAGYLPGDLVSCMVGNRPHIMVVSDRRSAEGVPLVIHNIGRGAQEEDRLFEYKLTGQYRLKITDESNRVD